MASTTTTSALRSLVVAALFALTTAFGGAVVFAQADSPAPPAPPPPDAPNGFRLTGLAVSRAAIVSGGPARDAIRQVDEPKFAPLDGASWVRADTPVIGVVNRGDARAYPIHIMEYHQVVNDVIGGAPIIVTYDPLTDTALAYRAKRPDRTLHFGVSGLIYNSNFLVYDRETESLWSQFAGRSLAGPAAGASLERVRTRVVSMARWVAEQPETRVLERPARYEIDYRFSRYSEYWTSKVVPFPVEASDARFHPKEVVLGIASGGLSRAYLGSILTRAGGRIVDDFAGHRVRVEYDGETGTFSYDAPPSIHAVSAYWFAWKAFHPETGIWRERPETETEDR